MPLVTVWADPALFMVHNGVKIFHAYKDDDLDQGPLKYAYTTRDDDDGHAFDIRHLDVPSRELLERHPPFLSKTSEPFASASPEQQEVWRLEWKAWQAHGGGEEQAIRQILIDAIEHGLLPPPETE